MSLEKKFLLFLKKSIHCFTLIRKSGIKVELLFAQKFFLVMFVCIIKTFRSLFMKISLFKSRRNISVKIVAATFLHLLQYFKKREDLN
jgi:hypothetical protein